MSSENHYADTREPGPTGECTCWAGGGTGFVNDCPVHRAKPDPAPAPERLNLEEAPQCDGNGECFTLAAQLKTATAKLEALEAEKARRTAMTLARPALTRDVRGALYCLREEVTHAHKRAMEGEAPDLVCLEVALGNVYAATADAMGLNAPPPARPH